METTTEKIDFWNGRVKFLDSKKQIAESICKIEPTKTNIENFLIVDSEFQDSMENLYNSVMKYLSIKQVEMWNEYKNIGKRAVKALLLDVLCKTFTETDIALKPMSELKGMEQD